MRSIRRFLPLGISLGLVLGIGAIGFTASADANDKAKSIHRADRVILQKTLAGLGNQYMLFGLKEANDYTNSQQWSLRPGDPGDRQKLEGFVQKSAFFNQGAVLSDLAGRPINVFARPPGLPSATDPGFAPLRSDLLARRPGVSSVMKISGLPVVGFAVPVVVNGAPRAILTAFFRTDQSPLQTYTQKLEFGKTGVGYTVDSQGGVVTASDSKLVGSKLPSEVSRTVDSSGGFAEFERDGKKMVVSYQPFGVGGWGTLTEQESKEFFGPIEDRGRNVSFALIALLVAAAAGLAVLNQKRQEALRRAYEYKGEALANITHELKTPLTAIRGAATTLQGRWRKMPVSQVNAFLEMIHRRCDGLGDLVERILQVARLEAGRELMLRPEPVEVAGILKGLDHDFGTASEAHSLKVAPAEDVWVTADPKAVDQMMGLLIENAIKYSPDGGDINVDVTARENDVLFRVADHGVGMTPDEAGHVFEPYFKADRGDSTPYGGAGLGLAITSHLVRRQGGDIWVSSKPAEGSVFSFTLPRTAAPPRPVAVVAPPRKKAAAPKKRNGAATPNGTRRPAQRRAS